MLRFHLSAIMDQRLCYLAFLFCSFILAKILFRQKKNLPPSPFALPVVGHLHLLASPLYKSLRTLSAKYGPIMLLKFGSRSVLVVSSPSAVEECFTKNDVVFANRPQSMAGDNLTYNYTAYSVANYGHFWRILRRLTVLEIFTSKSIQKYSPVMEQEVRFLLRRILMMSSEGTQKVDLNFLFGLLTTNFSMRIAFGKRFLEEEELADTAAGKKSIEEFKKMAFPNVLMYTQDFIPVLRLIGYGGLEKSLKKMHAKSDEYFQNLLDSVRQEKKSQCLDKAQGREGKRSLAEILLTMQESDPHLYNDEVIKSTSIMMMVAGNETVSVTLEWAMSLLLNHPEKLQKMKDEIDSQVEHERFLNESNLEKLPYLNCVIKETLRLYPPLPLSFPHLSSESCTVGGFEVPGGTMLMVNIWALHRDPKIWSDPNEFKPERFEEDSSERGSYKFIPFGMGRRACPGANLGIHILSLALGALIQCFKWDKIGPREDMKECLRFSLTKDKPLEALCTPRPNMIKLLSHV